MTRVTAMGGHSARSAVRSDAGASREPRDDVRWPPMAARRVVFRAFWGRQRRLTMSRIAGATLPAQKTRKDDHTYHPIMIEGTESASRRGVRAPQAARDDVRKPRNAAIRVAFPAPLGGRGGAPRIRCRGDTPRWPLGASGRLSDGPPSPAPPLLPRKREKRSYECNLADAGH